MNKTLIYICLAIGFIILAILNHYKTYPPDPLRDTAGIYGDIETSFYQNMNNRGMLWVRGRYTRNCIKLRKAIIYMGLTAADFPLEVWEIERPYGQQTWVGLDIRPD